MALVSMRQLLDHAAENGYGIPFVKPWEGKELYDKAERLLAPGCPVLGVDVDAAGLITLRKTGVDAIVVSNHGGRVLDHCPGTAEVLPAIAEAVRGHIHILVDGGIRTGVDVLKMLALGAEAVLIGRPVSVAAIGGGLEGVKAYFEGIKGQLTQAMLLTGCASLGDINESILYRG